ncbi:MAG TPA: hypothetical protein VEB69_13185 [Acidimicrobiia bacterium]|nr:hypothetical protein [Acidimicrobiia bacterium]
MRRLAALVGLLTLVPATAASGAELDELLTRSNEATYSAEQTISCSTPDGVRDAVVRITQTEGELRVSSSVTDEVEVAAGGGTWSVRSGDGLVAEAAVDAGEKEKTVPLYTVEEEEAVEYLGRAAMSYLLIRDGEPRGELTFDNETGALVEAITFTLDDEIYCERRFTSIEAEVGTVSALDTEAATEASGTSPVVIETSELPEEVSGFELLDQYEDEDGLRFSYYTDGFFSFAVFETDTPVELPEAVSVDLQSGHYARAFAAGQVTYVWETVGGGMALVGDLPPDLHEAVLAELPHPQDPGFFRRWWRNLFG